MRNHKKDPIAANPRIHVNNPMATRYRWLASNIGGLDIVGRQSKAVAGKLESIL